MHSVINRTIKCVVENRTCLMQARVQGGPKGPGPPPPRN